MVYVWRSLRVLPSLAPVLLRGEDHGLQQRHEGAHLRAAARRRQDPRRLRQRRRGLAASGSAREDANQLGPTDVLGREVLRSRIDHAACGVLIIVLILIVDFNSVAHGAAFIQASTHRRNMRLPIVIRNLREKVHMRKQSAHSTCHPLQRILHLRAWRHAAVAAPLLRAAMDRLLRGVHVEEHDADLRQFVPQSLQHARVPRAMAQAAVHQDVAPLLQCMHQAEFCDQSCFQSRHEGRGHGVVPEVPLPLRQLLRDAVGVDERELREGQQAALSHPSDDKRLAHSHGAGREQQHWLLERRRARRQEPQDQIVLEALALRRVVSMVRCVGELSDAGQRATRAAGRGHVVLLGADLPIVAIGDHPLLVRRAVRRWRLLLTGGGSGRGGTARGGDAGLPADGARGPRGSGAPPCRGAVLARDEGANGACSPSKEGSGRGDQRHRGHRRGGRGPQPGGIEGAAARQRPPPAHCALRVRGREAPACTRSAERRRQKGQGRGSPNRPIVAGHHLYICALP
mmetsp:Transcript_79725/g.258267  ORF Transcript_79725/g.258267 Transcript_79725/m.258267 type:complete len:514 (+) Transcript_79725:1229-2770(+)